MARDTTRSKTTRVRTGNILRDDPTQLTVAAPSFVFARSGSAQAAQALAELARAGTALAGQEIIRREVDGFQQAVEDFAMGVVDQELLERNRGYRQGRDKLRAQADWARLMPQFEEELRQLDTDSMSEEELNATIDELFRREFAGAEEEPFYAQALADELLAFRLRHIGEHKMRTLAAAREAEEADLLAVMQNDFARTGSFDYDRLSAEVNRMRDGAERNQLYAQVLFDTAIDGGLPEVIEAMPDRHPDGTPTIKHIPSWQEKIRAAIVQAQAIKDHRERQEAKAAEEARKARVDAVRRQAILMAAQGIDSRQFLMDNAADFTSEELAAALANIRPTLAESFERARNPAAMAAVQAQISADPASVNEADLLELYRSGELFGDPTSNEAFSAFRLMLADLDSARASHARVMSDPIAAARLSELSAVTEPTKDVLGRTSPLDVALSAEIQRRFKEGVVAGADPRTLQQELIEEYNERRKGVDALRLNQSPLEAAAVFASGRLGAADIKRAWIANDWTPSDFEVVRVQNPELYRAILMAVLE